MSIVKCTENHLFSTRRYGNVCPYCKKIVDLEKCEKHTGIKNPEQEDLEEEERMLTGWLVCTEGLTKYKDYKILTGKTFVGRADGMDIQIVGDKDISKYKHAVFIYDDKDFTTLLISGESKKLIYVNGEVVFDPVILKPYDKIQMGKNEFSFIPFCGNRFSWGQNENGNDNKEDSNKNDNKNDENRDEEEEEDDN